MGWTSEDGVDGCGSIFYRRAAGEPTDRGGRKP